FIKICEELFSAARSEFKHMEYFYFHNCLYDFVWKDNGRRWTDKIPTWDVLHKYPHDYKVIFVGDASMSPYEITVPGGSVEYFNEEAGAVWMQRVLDIYESAVWLNPVPDKHWEYAPSIKMLKNLFSERMYPLTLSGIDGAMAELRR
ncbi:MAG: VWA domain-containing protein, partial [Pseudomonadota bacterium]